MTIATTAHASFRTVIFQEVLPMMTAILAALIGVNQHWPTRFTSPFDFESTHYHHKVFHVTAPGDPRPRSEVVNLTYYRPDMPDLYPSSRANIEQFLSVNLS